MTTFLWKKSCVSWPETTTSTQGKSAGPLAPESHATGCQSQLNHVNLHSKKTYKTQLKKFGIKKNVRLGGKDALQAVQLIKGAEELGLELADKQVRLPSGQVVGFERLARHVGRKKLTVGGAGIQPHPHKFSRHASATSPMPRSVDGPDAFRLPELVLLDVARYISQKFSVGPAALNPEIRGPDNPLAIEAHSTIEDAANLLADGKLKDAIVQLRVAPERLKRLLGNGDVEPPMTLFLIWKTIVSLTASARWAGLDVEETVKSLVRYTAIICNASPSISPQIRRILSALSQLAQIDGHLMFRTAEQGILCMCAQHDLARKSFLNSGLLWVCLEFSIWSRSF